MNILTYFQKGSDTMIAYEFYWVDKKGQSTFYAILPERRKNTRRITEESIMKWGRMVCPNSGPIYFTRVEVPEAPAHSRKNHVTRAHPRPPHPTRI